MASRFRVGSKVARHVYDGDVPLFTAASDHEALDLVDMLNRVESSNRLITAYRERMDRDSDGYMKSLGEVAEIQGETAQRNIDLENENAKLKAIVDAVDDILLVNWIAPEGGYGKGDYRKALHDLVSRGIAEHNDPLISEPAALRQELLQSAAEMNAAIRLLRSGNPTDGAIAQANMMAEQVKRNMALLGGGNPDDTVLPQTRGDLERERNELVKAAELVIAWDDDDEAISGTLDFEPLREALKLAKALREALKLAKARKSK